MPGNSTYSTTEIGGPVIGGPLRAIIIDDSRDFMAAVRRMLATYLPHIEITEYDAEQQGRPDREFDWSLYDILLIGDRVGGGEDGLDWLAAFQSARGFPPAVLMAEAADDYLAARAIKRGAWDYIRKSDISPQRIVDVVVTAVAALRERQAFDITRREERASPHLLILERLARQMPTPVGTDAGVGYRYVRLIGQGASSRVYLAERTTDGSTLVLKVIDGANIADSQIVERFIREAELVSSVSSPYVVRFYDYGLTQTYGYIAMEFFTRGDLKQRVEHGVAAADALNYVRHIALGLDAIHQHGIVHRDLKPGNIMFRADDSLALADFGISRRLDQMSDLTNLGSVLGTPNYLSPEQALGQPVDQRADLYSAGVILFELLAGRKPFRAESAAALVYQHVHAPVPALPPELQELQPLIERLMAKQCTQRPRSAAELVAALDQLLPHYRG